jgi:hypothetical protein
MRESPEMRNSIITRIPPAPCPGVSASENEKQTNIEIGIGVTIPEQCGLVVLFAKVGVSEIWIVRIINIGV